MAIPCEIREPLPDEAFARCTTTAPRSEDVGTQYPALHRMEQEGWIESAWAVTDAKRRARVYTLTAAGRRQLTDEEESWQRLMQGVSCVLNFA